MDSWMKRVIDGGPENCNENVRLAVQDYTEKILSSFNPLPVVDTPIVCVALKNVLKTVMDNMDGADVSMSAMINGMVGCESHTEVFHEQDS